MIMHNMSAIDADTPGRFNADPRRLFEASGSAAKAVGDALGREVIYEPIGIAEFRRQLEQFGLPEQTIQHLCAVALDFQEGLFAGTMSSKPSQGRRR
jgi:hypothetical protein